MKLLKTVLGENLGDNREELECQRSAATQARLNSVLENALEDFHRPTTITRNWNVSDLITHRRRRTLSWVQALKTSATWTPTCTWNVNALPGSPLQRGERHDSRHFHQLLRRLVLHGHKAKIRNATTTG